MSTVITDNEAKSAIGENVSRLLAERGWTQRQLADAISESKMNISRIARGKHVPGVAMLSRIAEALGVTVDDLLRRKQRSR